jgi:heat shock protein HslJ
MKVVRTLLFALLSILVCAGGLAAQERGMEFPYDQDFLLDAAPKPGSDRVPTLSVQENGDAMLNLWCSDARGQFIIAGETVTILIGAKTQRGCTPATSSADDSLIDALSGVTTWSATDTALDLHGPVTLHFLVSSH